MRNPKAANEDVKPTKTPLQSVQRRPLGLQRDLKQTINWRRGFFRVWLLVSASWIMAWIIYLIMQGIQGELKSNRDFLELPVLLFGPPVALLIVGFGVGWSLRGFKVDEPAEH